MLLVAGIILLPNKAEVVLPVETGDQKLKAEVMFKQHSTVGEQRGGGSK